MVSSLLLASVLSGRNLPPPVAPFGMELLPTVKVVEPMFFPIIGKVSWRDTYNQVRGSYRHTGQDLRARKMTPIIAPFSGRLGFKEFSFWIYGDNGLRCLATHLNNDTPGTNDNEGNFDYMFAPNLRPGDQVMAGQLIGYVGDSGNATGPHLHFEIYNEKGIRNPLWSLKAAQRLTQARLRVPDPEDVPAPGQERWDVCWRALDPAGSMLKVIIVSRQQPGGIVRPELKPSFAWVTIQPAALAEGPAFDEIALFPQDRLMTLFVRRHENGIEVERFKLMKNPDQPS